MQSNIKFDKLNFITAGMPLRTGKGSYPEAFGILKEMNLDGMELEFVHGIRINDASKEIVASAAKENNFVITAHGPFYINLSSKEREKINASVQRIVDTAIAASQAGAFSITYHAAFYMGGDKETVYNQVKFQHERIFEFLEDKNTNVWIRPETTGKATQWGDLDEVIRLSNDFEKVLPCIDFSHLHARTNGEFNTYDEFSRILERLGKEIGQYALDNFHGHLAGIEYGEKGEKQHLIIEESDMNYKDLLRVMKEFGVKGALVCESPNIEDDCKLFKDYYYSI